MRSDAGTTGNPGLPSVLARGKWPMPECPGCGRLAVRITAKGSYYKHADE
jgi:hypothetical protein